MRYLTIRFAALALLLLAFFANSCRAQQILRVNESRIRMQADPNATRVDLPIQNASPRSLSARVLVELVDPKGEVIASASQDAILSPDTKKVRLSLPTIAELARAANPQASLNLSVDLRRSLAYLAPRVTEYDEPYILALYALSAFDLGNAGAATQSLDRLRSLEHREGNASYWSLETNTPFYGWGLAGRIETTALVLQALAKSPDSVDSTDLISRGLLFLLHNQDRYGIWYSTQATFDVLNTLGSLAA